MNIDRNQKIMILSMLFVLSLMVFNQNGAMFQVETIPVGTWNNLQVKEVPEKTILHPDAVFQTAETSFDGIDEWSSTSFGSYDDLGMGTEGTETSTILTEEGYIYESWSNLDTQLFSSTPAEWYFQNWGISGGFTYSSAVSGVRRLITKEYITSDYTALRFKFAWKSPNNNLEYADYIVRLYIYTTTYIEWSNPASSDTDWHTIGYVETSHIGGNAFFEWYTSSSDSTETFYLDSFILDAKSSVTYYKVDIIFRFTAVDYGSYYIEQMGVNFGGSEAETLDVYGGASLPTTLLFNSWNYASGSSGLGIVDVHSYLTGQYFYVRFVDEVQYGDTDQSAFTIEECYLVLTNTAPVVDSASACINDDGGYLYANYKSYIFTSNVSDVDGYSDIDFVRLYFGSAQGDTLWSIEFNASANVFSEYSDTNDYITLDISGSSYIKSGSNIDITWLVTINWNHVVITAMELDTIVQDLASTTDINIAYISLDVETRLEYLVSPNVDDNSGTTIDRGDLNGQFFMSGTLVYYDSAVGGYNYPPDDTVDVWAYVLDSADYGTITGPFSDSSLATGVFNITCYSDNVVGLDSWYVRPVVNGDGSTDDTLLWTTDAHDDYISDRIEIYSAAVTDGRIDISTQGTTTWYMRYDYLDQSMGNVGTFILNGSKTLSYVDTNTWRYQETKTSVQAVGYEMLSVAENTHGLTGFVQTASDQTIIWDRIQVQSYTVTDVWVNIGTSVNIDFLMYYDYNNTPVTTGDFTLDGHDATHMGAGTWRIVNSSATPAMFNFSEVVVTGVNTYDISTVDLNGKWKQVVWDSVVVSFAGPTDNRQTINANASGIIVTLTLSYNGTAHGGTATLNSTDFNGDGTVVRWVYTVVSVSGGTYGITTIGTNDETYMIWDQIKVMGYTSNSSDNHDNIGTYVNISVWLHYDYDETNVTTGAITINGQSYIFDGVSNWTAVFMNATHSTTIWNDVATAGDDTYQISSVNQNGKSITYIWDSLTISLTGPTDNRQNINANASGIIVSATYDEGGTYNGGFILNNTDYNGNGTVTIWYYTVLNVDGVDTYGITSISTNDVTYMIWDRVIWQSYQLNSTQNYGANGYRNDTGKYFNITMLIQFEYDNADVTNGTITLNGESCTHIDGGYWYINVINTTAAFGQDYTFDAITSSGNDFGITTINNNSQELVLIWDTIEVYADGCDYYDIYGKVNVGQNITLWASAWLVYDRHNLTSGDYIEFGGERMTWNGTHFTASYTRYEVGLWTFTINATQSYEANYTITTGINTPVNIVFDRILIYDMWLDDYLFNQYDNITVSVSLVSEYDNESMQVGLVQINGTLGVESLGDINSTFIAGSNWDNLTYIPAIGTYRWILTWANWTTYNLTVINYNGWNITYLTGSTDRVVVITYSTNSTDGRDNINTLLTIVVWLQYQTDSANVTDGTIIINGDIFTHSVDGNWTASFSNATASFANWTTVVAYGNSRGIEVVDQNGQYYEYIWDSYTVDITIGDNRINVGDNATIGFTVLSDYDSLAYDGTIGLNDTTYDHGTIGIYYYTLNTITGDDTYGITSLTNDVEYIIWDQIKVLGYVSNSTDNRDDVGTYVNVSVWLQYDYDDMNVTDGLVWINGQTLSYLVGWNWTALFMNTTTSDATWDSVSCLNNTYNITSVNNNSQSYSYIWDRVIITVATNMTWTVVTYYVNVSYTAIYEYDSSSISGYVTITNTTLTTTNLTHYEELTKTIVENYTFYATAFTDTSFSLTEFTTTTVWCIWDNITVNYVDYYTTVDLHNKKLFILFDYLYWQYNGSGIGANWICYNIRNGTAGSLAVTVLSSFLNPNWQEVIIPVSWNNVLYTNNATKTINGRYYNFQWYSLEIEIVAQMFLRNLIQEVLVDVVSISGTINTDAEYEVYNEIDGVYILATNGTVSVITDGIEEGFQITFDIIYTYGQHNFAINFTALTGVGSQWFNQSYVINFNIDIDIPEEKGAYMEIKGISNLDCDWYVYNSDNANWTGEDGTIEGGNNYFQFLFYMETTTGLHNYSLYFNVSSTVYIWKNGSYYVGNVYGLITVTLYDGQSNVFVDNNYKMYVNGTRSPSMTFYNRTDYTFNLTFTDYFGYTVHSVVYDYARFIDIQLDVYTFKVYSEMSSEFIYFNLTRTGGATFSQHLAPSEILTYRLIAGDYTYHFKKINGPNFDYYTGSFTLDGDTSYIVSDISLKKLWDTVESDTNQGTNLKPLMAAMNSMASSLAMIQWVLLILSVIIIGLMIFRGYTTDEITIGPDGKPIKKKRKLPKALEKFQFVRGVKNPSFKGIPKGAGQDAWSKAGVTFKKDES